MRLHRRALLAAALSFAAAPAAFAAPQLGQPAPAFQAMDADGHMRSLEEFRGRTVVLEWTSSDCPYCGKHYNSGNMQRLQKAAVKDGVARVIVRRETVEDLLALDVAEV